MLHGVLSEIESDGSQFVDRRSHLGNQASFLREKQTTGAAGDGDAVPTSDTTGFEIIGNKWTGVVNSYRESDSLSLAWTYLAAKREHEVVAIDNPTFQPRHALNRLGSGTVSPRPDYLIPHRNGDQETMKKLL